MKFRTETSWIAGTGRAAAKPAASVGRPSLRVPLAALVLCACVLACTPGLAHAAESDSATERWPVRLGAGSTLWIEGSSTLHDWSSKTDSTVLAFQVASGTAKPADTNGLATLVRAQGVRNIVGDVPVHSLRSKDSKLDKNLWKAMRADEYPSVHFELSSYAPGPARADNDTLAIHAKGTLTICGKSRPIELDALAHAGEGGLWLVGSEDLLMTDYGIKPPTMMMGTIRTGDRINVHYRLLLVPGTAGGSAASGNSDEKGARK